MPHTTPKALFSNQDALRFLSNALANKRVLDNFAIQADFPIMFQTGVVIGKFLPLHRGHEFLIETARSQVQQLSIIVCERHTDFVPGATRAAWVRELFPEARVLLVRDEYDQDDSSLWARLTIEWLGFVPDVAFTSENYGQHWARFMGCEHVLVDLKRARFPVSGTIVRTNPRASWEFLTVPAREQFALRVCVLGAESSGTTTLAQAVAAQLNTSWVEEYGREFCALKYGRGDFDWHSDEFALIAVEQKQRIDTAARTCNSVVVCDTDAFTTRLWHFRYAGFWSEEVERIAREAKTPDLYVLTSPDIPFVQDGLRDGEHLRFQMHEQFIQELNNWKANWILAIGTIEERVAQVLVHVETMI